MMRRELPILLGLLVAAASFCAPARAGVVVLTSHAQAKVALVLIHSDGRQTRHSLNRGEVLSVPVVAGVTVVFDAGGALCRRVVQANGIYQFQTNDNRMDLVQQPLPGFPTERPAPTPTAGPQDAVYTIPVKVLVDQKEPMLQRFWEKRYRTRIAAASEIIERHCRIRFEVVALGTWTSDDGAQRLEPLIAEFERTVNPAPARLAIGFTGQYKALGDEKSMGGTRGPFRAHILIREWGRQITESERLEMLVHELGHFLGAVHSPERQSVMRPDISDRQSRARAFRIGFDAPNTLALCLIGEELRNRPLTHLGQLSPDTRDQLRAVYASLAAALPADPAAPGYLAMLGRPLTASGKNGPPKGP